LASPIQKLASFGWSIPVYFTDSDIKAINECDEVSEDDVTSVITDFYCADDNLNLSKLLQHLINTPFFEEWKSLLQECFDVFKSGQYRVCSTSLIPIAEGCLIKNNHGTIKSTQIKVIGSTEHQASQIRQLQIDSNTWKSIEIIISKLFEKSYFNLDEPTLNRHWIVHGRSSYQEPRIASLKLFNLLGTISLAV